MTWLTGLGLELMKDGANRTKLDDLSLKERVAILQHLPGQKLAQVIQEEAHRRCGASIQRDAEHAQAKMYPFNMESDEAVIPDFCPKGTNATHRCFVNYNHFDDQITESQLHGLWSALSPDLRVVLLERDVKERWKSWQYAQKTGDWEIGNLEEHRKKIDVHADIPTNGFLTRHSRWYTLLRDMLQEPNGSFANLTSVEVTFEEVINNQTETRKKIFDAIMARHRTHP